MEILRKLKRAIAREIFKLLTRQIAVPEYNDLRPARQAKKITLTAAANHFGVWPTVISRIERGLQRDDTSPSATETGSRPFDTNRSIMNRVERRGYPQCVIHPQIGVGGLVGAL